MDPFVRVALAVQQLALRASGVGLSAALGVYLVWWAAGEPPPIWTVGASAVLVVTVVARVVRRLRKLAPVDTRRLDLELCTHLVVVGYAAVLLAPGQLDGPYYGGIYALMMLIAGFTTPLIAVSAVGFAVGLETAITCLALGKPVGAMAPHAALLAVFALLNMFVFRAEIARVRKLSRARIDGEIEKMKEAARSYRLLGAPTSIAEPQSLRAAPKGDEERLLRSGVEEIRQALTFSLDLLRRSLGLRTAALLWKADGGRLLRLQEISTDEEAIAPGPFPANEGTFSAALTKREPLLVSGARARLQLPYYVVPRMAGSVCAAPLIEHGSAHGVLVADRDSKEPFSEREVELIQNTTRFVLRAVENERVFVQLERAKIEQGKLYRAADLLSAATTEAQVIEAGVSSAREFASFDFATVTLFDRTTGEHEICAASGDGADELVGRRFRHNSGLVSMVVANRHPLPYRGSYDPARQVVFTRRLAPPDMPSLLVLPLLVHEKALGTLVLGSVRPHAFGEAVRPTLEVLASHIAVSLANARMLKRLEELATTDGLTGLLNKRTVTQIAIQKIRSACRFEKPLSLLICDIDHFKKVNDTYGHDVGDLVIQGFSRVFRRNKRDTDVVGRFGGEEFVVVCEETDTRGAMLLAERIRNELEATTFRPESQPLQVTCSVGIATFDPGDRRSSPGGTRSGRDFDALFKAADEALYVSKRSGRNRSTAWAPSMRGCAA